MKQLRHIVTVLLAIVVLCISATSGLALAEDAADNNSADANTVPTTKVQQATGVASVSGYAADSKMQFGTIVQLAGDNAKKVVPASGKALNKMHGVVVDPHLLSLTLTDPSLQNETYVATSGTFDVLVSTQAGTINEGDYVTMSALDGVGMKAGEYEDQPMVFGRAASGFDGKSSSLGSVTLQYSGGSDTETVQLGLISVAVNIQRNPNDKSTKPNLPQLLEKVGKVIAERHVSAFRIYLSIIVMGLSIIVALVTLYSGVKNAVISIGRNPLTKKSIFRGLLEIILTGFLILIVGLFAVYLLLKL